MKLKTILISLLLVSVLKISGQNVNETLRYYNKAGYFQKLNFSGGLANDLVIPHWIGETNFCWYKRQTETGSCFMILDAEKPEKKELFNHQSLAAQLYLQSGNYVHPDSLLLRDIEFRETPDSFDFSYFSQRWRFITRTQELKMLEAPYSNNDYSISPDHKKAVCLKDHNLWCVDIETGREKQLTFNGEKYYAYSSNADVLGRAVSKPNLLWSPDSKKIFTYQLDERQVKDLPYIEYAPADNSPRPRVVHQKVALPGDENIPKHRMTIIDVSSGEQVEAHYPFIPSVRMYDSPISGNRAWWNKDSKTAYFIEIERGEKEINLVEFNTINGETQILFSERTEKGYLETSDNVYLPSAYFYIQERNELVWYSQRTGYAHFYLYDLNTGKLIKQLTSGEWLVRNILGYDHQSGDLFFSRSDVKNENNPYYRQIAKVNTINGKMKVLTDNSWDHFVVNASDGRLIESSYIDGLKLNEVNGFSANFNYYIETIQRPDRPSKTYLRDRNGKEILLVEEMDTSRLPKDFIWPEPFTVKADDDETDICGVLFRPAGFTDDKKYPVIDNIYGGPQISHVPESFSEGAAIMSQSTAELDFVVIVVDGRGTTQRSRSFHEFSYESVQNASYLKDHIAAIKQLSEMYPYIDTSRVGIFGFSGGGYMTASAMLRYPDFFKVGVAGSGNHDQRLFWHSWGERYNGMPKDVDYSIQASLQYAKNLKGKLLLIHGLMDGGVHPAALFQLTQALINENKDFDLVLLPQKGHMLTGYGLRQQLNYFYKNLAGKTPPENYSLKSSDQLMMEKMGSIMMKTRMPVRKPFSSVITCDIETSMGNIELKLFPEKAPVTVANFVHYMETGKYDSTSFFRVTNQENEKGKDIQIAVVQGGYVNEAECYDPIELETTKETGLEHKRGTISMARGGVNTATSSFFICLEDELELNYGGMRNPDGQGFAAFGEVSEGMDVLLKIQAQENKDQFLVNPVIIDNIKITNKN